jgi:nucleoside-diphosphate-sugar epimerase
MASPRILVIGASGQLGTELLPALAQRYGSAAVLASDLREQPCDYDFVQLDVTDTASLADVVQQHGITQIYHLAALLSAVGEQKPQLAWQVNMGGLLNVLEVARERHLEKVFWPSSIAVFGPHSPRVLTPQYCVMDPTTIYGITKLAGERLCEYYFLKHGLDVRSLRYPGLIGWRAAPGGGTTDYAVEIYHQALKHDRYTSFLQAGTELPMMYMDDAVRATIELMEAPAESVRIRSSYNLAGMSFTPEQVAESIRRIRPNFSLDYAPDFRQQIADNWPRSIDDSAARQDWHWKPEFDLDRMTRVMLQELAATIG